MSLEAQEAESDLLPYSSVSNLPLEGKQHANTCLKEEIPHAIGKNEKYGWFILACGQGPMFIWKEKE